MTYVSFPGFGISPFHMNPVVFSVGPLSVRWYGLIITIGMILAVLLGIRHGKMEKVKEDDIIDYSLYLIIFGVLGARAYYVIMEFDNYIATGGNFLQNLGKTFYNCIAVWEGGLAIYGAIIAGTVVTVIYARKKHIRFPVMADIAAPSVMVGQIIGRWGNFVNVEAHGGETELPWRMGILTSFDNGETFISEQYVHPTFLYESLWNLLGFILIMCFYKKKKYHGQVATFYFAWYGFGRMLIEGLRTDSLMIGNMRVSQFVGFVCFVVGTILLITSSVKKKKQIEAKEDYAPVYGNTSENKNKEENENNGKEN